MDNDSLLNLKLPGLDFNGDGTFTVSDVGDWIMYLLTVPGDTVLSLLMQYAPPIATFLELKPEDLGGTLSLAISSTLWLIAMIALITIVSAIRSFDRWLSAHLGAIGKEWLRRLRVCRRRVAGWFGQLRRRHQSEDENIIVAEVDLEHFDTDVLRCYGSAGEMRILSATEVANSLKTSLRHVQVALRRLCEYHFVEPAFGTDNGREAHQITRAGQIYLIEH